MSLDAYYDTLTAEQHAEVIRKLDHADDTGLDVAIIDAVDVWYLLDPANRGPKPE